MKNHKQIQGVLAFDERNRDGMRVWKKRAIKQDIHYKNQCTCSLDDVVSAYPPFGKTFAQKSVASAVYVCEHSHCLSDNTVVLWKRPTKETQTTHNTLIQWYWVLSERLCTVHTYIIHEFRITFDWMRWNGYVCLRHTQYYLYPFVLNNFVAGIGPYVNAEHQPKEKYKNE